jgi:hypothetical protein
MTRLDTIPLDGCQWENTYIVTAAVDVELGRQDDTGDEGEEGRQDIKAKSEVGEDGSLDEGSTDAEENSDPRKDSNEDCVVDAGWVAGKSIGDDIPDQGGDEQSPKELQSSQTSIYNIDHFE